MAFSQNYAPELMSSHAWPPRSALHGVLAPPTGAALRGAHAVYVQHCSSDAFMGDREGSRHTSGWHFRGQAILAAVLSELRREHRLAHAGAATTVVFGGASAGARGAMVHLDSVRACFNPWRGWCQKERMGLVRPCRNGIAEVNGHRL